MTPNPVKRGRPPKAEKSAMSVINPPPSETVDAALLIQIDGLVDAETVSRLTSLSTQEIRRRVSEQRFPRPIQIGEMRKAWRISQVRDWINHMAAISHSGAGGTFATN